MTSYVGPLSVAPLYLMFSTSPALTSITVPDGTIYTPISPLQMPINITATASVWAVRVQHWQQANSAGLNLLPSNGYAVGAATAKPTMNPGSFFYDGLSGMLQFLNPGAADPDRLPIFGPNPGWVLYATGAPVN